MTNQVGNITNTIWTFGDGGILTTDALSSVSHVYTNAGVFTNAQVNIFGDAGSLSITSDFITVQASGPDPNAPTNQIFFLSRIHQIGSLASPNADGGSVVEVLLAGGSSTGVVYQESERDIAAFDIDRFPSVSTNPPPTLGPEDTDFFVQEGTCSTCPNDPLDTLYNEYSQPPGGPDRFRLVCTMGWYVFGTEPSRAGNFVLQAGRIED